MPRPKIGNITLGIVFIAFGVAYIAGNIFNQPLLAQLINWWPLIIMSIGLEFLIAGYRPTTLYSGFRFAGTNLLSLLAILLICIGANGFKHVKTNISNLNLFSGYSRYESNFTKDFAIKPQGVTQLVVDNELGSIQVQKGTGSEILIHASITVRNNDQAYAKTVSNSAIQINEGPITKLSLSNDLQLNQKKVQSITVNYLIKVPSGIDIDLRSKFGSIKADNLAGNLNIKNNNGAVSVNSVAGNVSITNSFGKVEGQNLQGKVVVKGQNCGIDLSKINGDVEVTNQFGNVIVIQVTGNTRVVNTNGDINLSVVNGDLRAENRFGTIDLQNVYGAVIARGENGPILLYNDRSLNKDVNITNQFGNITIRVPQTQVGRFIANTKFGNIHSDFSVKIFNGSNEQSIDQPVGNPAPQIILQNQNGNIEILNFKKDS